MAASGALVKTWAQRGTLHLHRTDELPLWVGAQAALKPRYEQKSWLKHFKLTPEDVQAILDRRPGGAARAARSPARSWPSGSTPGLAPRLRRPAQAGRVPRRADLHAAGPRRFALPGAVRAAGPGGGHAGGRAPLPDPLRAGHPRGPREVVRAPVAAPQARQGAGSTSAVETEFGWALERRRGGDRGRGAVRRRPAAARVRPVRRRRAARRRAPRRAPERIYRPGGWFSPVLLVDGVMAGVWNREDDVVTIEPFANARQATSARPPRPRPRGCRAHHVV